MTVKSSGSPNSNENQAFDDAWGREQDFNQATTTVRSVLSWSRTSEDASNVPAFVSMEDTDWISVPKRTSKSGRKFGLTGRRATFDEQRRVLPSSMTDYSMIIHQEHVERNQSDCNLSEREIEDKFNVISLTIRTEGLTLKHRLEHQHRQRDLVETNLEKEIQSLKSIFLVSLLFRIIPLLTAVQTKNVRADHNCHDCIEFHSRNTFFERYLGHNFLMDYSVAFPPLGVNGTVF